jgi:hypothetical protein
VVAGHEARDARAHVDDDARALVAEDDREQALRIGPRARELVGVADAGGLDLDEDLAGLGPVELDVLDDERLASLVTDGGTGAYGAVVTATDP